MFFCKMLFIPPIVVFSIKKVVFYEKYSVKNDSSIIDY